VSIGFDGPTKLVTLSPGTTSLDVNVLWSRWVDWFVTGDNSKYLPAFAQVGGNDIDIAAGTTIPAYIYVMNGWKIKPQEADHTLAVSGAVLLVDGGGDPFVDTIGAFTVRINYQQPVQAITVATGGGATPSAAAIASEVWDTVPVTPVSGSFGDILMRRVLTVARFIGLK
jgi:hypothetical protein